MEEISLRSGYKIHTKDLIVLEEIEKELGNRFTLDTQLSNAGISTVIKFKRIVELGIIGFDAIAIVSKLKEFDQLRTLRLERCRLQSVPEINDQLEIIQLMDNEITGNLKITGEKLLYIDLHGNQIEELSVRKSPVKILNLSDNELGRFPDVSSTVLSLDLRNNQIEEIPSNIAIRYPHLRMLHLDGNHITKLPVFPDSLQVLTISRNDISGSIFLTASKLRRLEISANKIERLSGDSSSIEFLSARSNQLSSIHFDTVPEKLILDDNVKVVFGH